MSNYLQMSEAAALARKGFLEYQERAWGYFAKIFGGMIDHCGVPDDHIVYLKWNGQLGAERRFKRPEGGGNYSLPGAVAYEPIDNCFNVGGVIYLTPATHAPRQFVRFAVWIGEKNAIPWVKLGSEGKPKPFRLKENAEVQLLCEEIAKDIVDLFQWPPKEDKRSIGFDAGPLNE